MTDTKLTIATLPVNALGGAIGITLCPGKKGISTLDGKPFDRDLDTDLDAVAEWGAVAVLTLMPRDELARYKVAALGAGVRAHFIEWHHLPIKDLSTPDQASEAAWEETSRRLRSLLAQGNRVLVHCRGGLGRAGMIVARLLVEIGLHEAAQAIAKVRSVRPGAVETSAQVKWVGQGKVEPTPGSSSTPRLRALGALLGLAAGDAFGTTLEFTPKKDRATQFDIVGGGPFDLEPGHWTDDTAMTMALATSLAGCNGFHPQHVANAFCDWYTKGSYSSNGRCFDIGTTTSQSLRRHLATCEPFAGSTDPHAAGNGSIMRLAPVAIRYWSDRGSLTRVAEDQSRITHGAPQAVRCCRVLADILADAIAGVPLHKIVKRQGHRVTGFAPGQRHGKVKGNGYVADSLHAAFWAVARTSSFEEAIVMAANLGQDADTTAAVAGQIAGAVYGMDGIPRGWLAKIARADELRQLASDLYQASTN